MLKLACPSCGANLELPDQLDIAHCMYCGGKIILRSENVLNEIVNVKRFSELAQFAFEAKDYQAAINYSNRILEIDTQNIYAWRIKAESVFHLSTPEDDRFAMAMDYLSIASKISSLDNQIVETKNKLKKLYSVWLNNRGLEALTSARQTHQCDDYMQAVELLIAASDHDPYNISILESIKVISKETQVWMPKNPALDAKLTTLGALHAKYQAQQMIPYLEKTLKEAKTKLRQLDGKQGFFDKLSRANLESTVHAFEKDLERKQVIAAYEPS